jgi:ribosomal-protein-alanine N-acetyltransferase
MSPEDVPEVMAVERAAYSGGWPATAFERELTGNGMARYIVLEEAGAGIAGFAGLWLMVDEAHVVTVAVLPEERRRGLGRLLVHGLVDLAIEHGMSVATLEVRESNQAARALYREYGFYEVGERKRYYSDNRENAVIMTTEELTGPAYQRRLEGLAAELRRRFPGIEFGELSGE